MNKEIAAPQLDTLEEFVKSRITVNIYERLPEALGITKYAITAMFNRPRSNATFDNVKALAKLLDCKPKFLVERYGIGMETIFLNEAKEIGFVFS
jgi:DNA-binding Xre family transcriptional regulator